jgi:uncharacterized protein YaiL (DUF2058 family)
VHFVNKVDNVQPENDLTDCIMGKTFQEQMLALGLADKKKLNQNKKQQHQQKKQAKPGKKTTIEDENVLLAREALEKKKARTRQLNREREEKLQKRADEARIKQLIEQNKVAKDESGVAYRFNCNGRIQRIFVSAETTGRLSSGVLGIVGLAGQFEVVPGAVVKKIKEIDDSVFFVLNAGSVKQAEKEADPEDPYAGYEVPDDLMW